MSNVWAARAAAIILLAAAVCAAGAVRPWQAPLPAGSEVPAADAVGLNVLEPVRVAADLPAVKSEAVAAEQAVREWTPTGGGGARPKPSPKG
jgi:hypothetical protein